ncbi:MAG: hypothetical protein KGZ44_04625 [Dethiobacter sp.]|nr:hypothetical protein [Dethiobacter sp.]
MPPQFFTILPLAAPLNNAGLKTGSYDLQYEKDKGNLLSISDPLNQTHTHSYDNKNNLVETIDPNNNVSNNHYDNNSNNIESLDAYTQAKATRYFSNGNIDYDTGLISSSENLLINPSLERFASGVLEGWTYAAGSATALWDTIRRSGNRSISFTNVTSNVVFHSDVNVAYTPADTFVLSGYVRTANLSTNAATIQIDALNASDSVLQIFPATRVGGTMGWTRLHVAVSPADIPQGTTHLRATISVTTSTGTAYFDDLQFERGPILTAYNLIENSGMEHGNELPNQWTGTNLTTNDRIDTARKHAGNRSFRIVGDTNVNKSLMQRVNITGDANTKLTLSGWSFADNPNPSGGWYNLQMRIFYNDSTTDWSSANNFSTQPQTDWQHLVAEFKPAKAFNAVEIYLYFFNQRGNAWFDDIRLEYGNNISSYSYDAGHNYLTSYKDPLGNTTTFVYDAVGNRTRITDPKGFITNFSYNNMNWLTSVTDADNRVTTYGYDANGNRTSVTDARNNTTAYEYNRANQVSAITDPLNRTISFTYGTSGLLNQILYPNGNRMGYRYNHLNRPTTILMNDTPRYSFQYDNLGNRTVMTDIAQSENTSYLYYADNNLRRVTEFNNNRTDYLYDAAGSVTRITATVAGTPHTTDYMYDRLYQLTRATFGSGSARFVYDENGNIAGNRAQNNVNTKFTYNDAKMLTRLQTFGANGSILGEYNYQYDANGNWTQVAAHNGTVSYQYDNLNRLTRETYRDGTIVNYTYDANGNRITRQMTQGGTTTTTNYQYGAANQLTSVNVTAYTYDLNGNMTSDGVRTYSYDAANRLTEVRQGATVIASYSYDADGRRTSMTTSAGTTRFFYDGTSTRVLYETNASGTLLARYIYGPNNQLLAMIRGGVTYYYHYNGHGDVVALTDASGTVVATYEYDAFGNHIGNTGSVVNPYRYAGYRWDAETGLYYLNARYYAPGIGRFITRDAFHGFEDDPASLNWYNYAHSNPVMFVDPSGYVIVNVIGAVVGAGLGALFGVLVGNHYRLTGWKRTATIAGFAAGMAVVGWFAAPFLSSLASLVLIKAGLTKATRMDLQLFAAKKRDIKQIVDVANKYRMSDWERRAFGDYIELWKGQKGQTLSWAELDRLAREFLGGR